MGFGAVVDAEGGYEMFFLDKPPARLGACDTRVMGSVQTLSESDRRVVALWAADCAARVLPLFEAEAPDDGRAGDGIDRTRAFGRGELDAASQIRQRFEAGRSAQSATSPAAVAAARAAGQASGVAHMGAHALGAAAYAAKAAGLAADDFEAGRSAEVAWQLEQLRPETTRALAQLPLLGQDTAGPLGQGLLMAPQLASTINQIQDHVTAR